MIHVIYEIRCHIILCLGKNFWESIQLSWYKLLHLAAILLNNVLLWLLQFLDVVETTAQEN